MPVTVPSLRLLAPDTTSRCRVPGFGENRGQGSAESHGRVQPAAGVPPSAPGRGKLRREVGGGRLETGRRGYCSRERSREMRRDARAGLKTVKLCDRGWDVSSVQTGLDI